MTFLLHFLQLSATNEEVINTMYFTSDYKYRKNNLQDINTLDHEYVSLIYEQHEIHVIEGEDGYRREKAQNN